MTAAEQGALTVAVTLIAARILQVWFGRLVRNHRRRIVRSFYKGTWR